MIFCDTVKCLLFGVNRFLAEVVGVGSLRRWSCTMCSFYGLPAARAKGWVFWQGPKFGGGTFHTPLCSYFFPALPVDYLYRALNYQFVRGSGTLIQLQGHSHQDQKELEWFLV